MRGRKECNCDRVNEKGRKKETRPVTRSIPVVDGWARVEMHIFNLLNLCSRTDGPTDRLL